ncbi:lytic murein transglycosylase [Mycobacterium sp. WMMD1722]|uniref:lytic transglycosylase domain-containing protein n=1 Tax=Mycobacterium sp. WMMD1722 TaxID=3404117 RepID=UPI003BF5442C
MQRIAALVLALAVLTGCSPGPSTPPPAGSTTPAVASDPPRPPPAERVLASDPVRLADDLVSDERVLRGPASPEDLLVAAASRQQAAYRVLGRRPEWDPVAQPRIPPGLRASYDRNVEARRELTALSAGQAKATLPAWRIIPPPPAPDLMRWYREAETMSGVGWSYLAAINLIENGFGRIAGVSTAGAQGPMQFLPSTFAAYGSGGDINSPRDAIIAAGRFLDAHGFARDPDHALYRYNNSSHYVRAVRAYAAVLADDPEAFAGYYRWDVTYTTTAGDVVLPVGYAASAPIPVEQYRRTRPR